MAHDNTIPLGKPGIASFESESYGNSAELLFGDTPAVVTDVATVTAGAAIDWPLATVVNIAANGAITKAVVAAGASNGNAITAAPIVMANGQSMSIPIYKAGHFRQQALTFDATFTTDALKKAAVPNAPMILISKAKYVDDNFPA